MCDSTLIITIKSPFRDKLSLAVVISKIRELPTLQYDEAALSGRSIPVRIDEAYVPAVRAKLADTCFVEDGAEFEPAKKTG